MIEWLETHAALAGWAQAIGALLTLWVAFAVPAWQKYEAQREAETLLGPILSRSTDALSNCQLFVSEEHADPERFLSDLRRSIRELHNFPAQSLRPKMIAPFAQFRGAAEDALARFEDELSDADKHPAIQAANWGITSLSIEAAINALGRMSHLAPRLKLDEAIDELARLLKDEEGDHGQDDSART